MVPVNVKLDDVLARRLDAAIQAGFATNRSDGLRIALDHQLAAWDELAWTRAWEEVDVPDGDDEFGDWSTAAVGTWSDLDAPS